MPAVVTSSSVADEYLRAYLSRKSYVTFVGQKHKEYAALSAPKPISARKQPNRFLAYLSTNLKNLLSYRVMNRLRDLFFELREEVEGVKGGQVIEVGFAEFFQDSAVERGEQDLLLAAAVRLRGA